MFEHSCCRYFRRDPGFEADKVEFGSYDKENLCCSICGYERSTMRAQQVGPEKDIPNNARLSHGTIRSRQTLSRESN